MAIGKSKKVGKKKGAKRIADPFSRKEWYEVRAPAVFDVRTFGRTLCTKTTGTRVARDSLVGRVFEVSLGDLKKEAEDEAFRKFKLRVEEVSGKQCLTNFHGMTLATDKLRSLVRKWHTLIEAFVDVKTTDGFLLRLFCIGFTRNRINQRSKTSYAQSAQVRAIRKKMVEVMQAQASSVDINELMKKLIPETIGKEIEKATQSIYPMQNVFIRKVKVLRAPKVDLTKLLELHGVASSASSTGKKVERPKQ